MRKYLIKIKLIDDYYYAYLADNFIVVDSKLEIIIDKSVISYDFNLIGSISIINQEEDKWLQSLL